MIIKEREKMNNKIFYPIINDLYYYLNIDSKLSNIEKKCNKKANEMLLDNIKKDLSDILYNGCIECFVDYFHYLKKSGFIKGIEHEQRLSEFQEIMSSKDEGINNFFSRYSGLNDSLEKKIQLTISIIEEILYRYEIDKNIIKDKFKINGNIISIKHSLGDYHNGKTVCLLKFEKGLVVYKPRNSFVDELYNDLLDIVSKNDIQMMKIETINRDDYSWHEYISHYECSNMEQVHRFYYRAGVNLAIFYAIGTNDIHVMKMTIVMIIKNVVITLQLPLRLLIVLR